MAKAARNAAANAVEGVMDTASVPRARPRAANRVAEARQDRARDPAHVSREQGSRASTTGVDMSPWEGFQPQFDTTHLKAPIPRPGMDQRWIRLSTFGTEDVTNSQRQWQKGWRPRPADTIPVSFMPPTIQHGKATGTLIVEGMILCERPSAISQKFRDHNRRRIDEVTMAISAELRGAAPNNPAYGPIQHAHRTQFVREVKAAADEGAAE